MTSYLRKIIVTIAFVNDFAQGGRVELYRLVALYRCILIGQASNSFLRLQFSHLRYIFSYRLLFFYYYFFIIQIIYCT